MVSLTEKWKDKGFSVFAITDEAQGTIDSFVKERNMPYFVGTINKDVHTTYAIRGFPTVMLIDDQGKIANLSARGLVKATDDQIKELVKNYVPNKLDESKLTKATSSAGANYEAGKLAKARELAEKVKTDEKSDEADKASADYVISFIDRRVESTKAAIEELKANKEYLELETLVSAATKTFKGLPLEDELKELEKTVLKDSDVKKEIKALKQLESILDAVDKQKDNAKKKAYVPALEKIAEKNEGMKAAEKARAEIEKINALPEK